MYIRSETTSETFDIFVVVSEVLLNEEVFVNFLSFREKVTQYIFAEDEPEKADIIWIPGNAYPENAERAAWLYKQGFAPYILPSGRYSAVVGHFAGVQEKANIYNQDYQTEWEFLRDVLIKNGVKESAILREDQATYTWENARNSRRVIDESGLVIKKAILCCKNVHARRSLMYYQKAFPDTKIFVSPSVIENITKQNWYTTKAGIDAVNGELSRILYQFSLLVD